MPIFRMVDTGRSSWTRGRIPALVVGPVAVVIALGGCSPADDNPPNAVVSPSPASSAPAGSSSPAATPAAPAATPAPKPTPPPNPLEGFTGTYAYVETVTSSYYSADDVGDSRKGAWTVATDCTKKCVSEVGQKLKDEDQAFTITGKSGRFTGEADGSATCIASNGKPTGQNVNAVYTWDVKAGKAANGEIKALNGRKKFKILQNCKGQETKGFTITYQVSLRLTR